MSFGGKGEQYCDSWKRGVGSLVLRWERLNMNMFVCQEVSRKGPCEVQKREAQNCTTAKTYINYDETA